MHAKDSWDPTLLHLKWNVYADRSFTGVDRIYDFVWCERK